MEVDVKIVPGDGVDLNAGIDRNAEEFAGFEEGTGRD